ncbi:hypothetical protein EYF80_001062 [Liparis tanakae]|uniref:Uncharacterized protein n=1 Tax=Liparis tanakae TaxID=230148 RepID=A0A4Z2JEX5_9TELE|nr:hypothetical protein EYF80_001062 [Liparis tanakae]
MSWSSGESGEVCGLEPPTGESLPTPGDTSEPPGADTLQLALQQIIPQLPPADSRLHVSWQELQDDHTVKWQSPEGKERQKSIGDTNDEIDNRSSASIGCGGDSGQLPLWATHDRLLLRSPSPHSAPCMNAESNGATTQSSGQARKQTWALGGVSSSSHRLSSKMPLLGELSNAPLSLSPLRLHHSQAQGDLRETAISISSTHTSSCNEPRHPMWIRRRVDQVSLLVDAGHGSIAQTLATLLHLPVAHPAMQRPRS